MTDPRILFAMTHGHGPHETPADEPDPFEEVIIVTTVTFSRQEFRKDADKVTRISEKRWLDKLTLPKHVSQELVSVEVVEPQD